MKTYAFSIQKGGVGKTSLSGNIAYLIAKQAKVLLVDADPQGNASSWYLTESPDYELANVLQGEASIQAAIVNVGENFDILPTFGIGSELRLYGETKLNDEPFIFEDIKEEVKKLGYDYLIYDLSPGLGRLEKCILLAVDEVLTPIHLEWFSMDGIEIFRDALKQIKKSYRKDVLYRRIICNHYNRSFQTDMFETIRENLPSSFELFTIPQDVNIEKAQRENKSLFSYNPKARSIPEFENLANALMEA